MKVLVIRLSSIGDIVLTTPVLRCLKTQRPEITIHYLTKSSFRQVVEHNPYVDKFHYFDKSLSDTIKELKSENFDFIIDLHNNFRTGKIKRSLDAHAFTFRKLNFRKWLLVNFKIDVMPKESIVSRYMETVKHFGVHNDDKGLDYFTGKDLQIKDNDIPMSHRMGYIGFVIGGSYNTKKLPVEKWIELCKLVDYPIILLGGPEDAEDGNEISAIDKIRIYNSCGKFKLNESALLVQMSRLIVTNDTGLMHIAAAYNKKIISVWGNTSPRMGMFPYYNPRSGEKGSEIVVNNKLYCHPCSKLGFEKCPEGHFRCMNELKMNELADFIKNILFNPTLN
jgi:heptosyltransferase-2